MLMHSTIDEYLVSLQLTATIYCTTVNILAYVFLKFLLGLYQRVELLSHRVWVCSAFSRFSQMVFHSGCINSHSHWSSSCSTASLTLHVAHAFNMNSSGEMYFTTVQCAFFWCLLLSLLNIGLFSFVKWLSKPFAHFSIELSAF